jgi:hypothetical protein
MSGDFEVGRVDEFINCGRIKGLIQSAWGCDSGKLALMLMVFTTLFSLYPDFLSWVDRYPIA